MYRNLLWLFLRKMNGEEMNVETILQNYKTPFQRYTLFCFLIFSLCPQHLLQTPLLQSHPLKNTYPISCHQVLVFYLLYLSQISLLPSGLLPHLLFKLPLSPAWIVQQAPFLCLFACLTQVCQPPQSTFFFRKLNLSQTSLLKTPSRISQNKAQVITYSSQGTTQSGFSFSGELVPLPVLSDLESTNLNRRSI